MDRHVAGQAVLVAGASVLLGGLAAGLGRHLGHPEWAALAGLPVVWLTCAAGGWQPAVIAILAVPVGWWLASGEPVENGPAPLLVVSGIMAILLAFVFVCERMRQVRDDWERALHTDDLTGLLNRRGFRERLDAELNRARRNGTTLAVGMLDCDNFKELNDTFGHPTGDRVLQCAAGVLGKESRNDDLAARVGGDEFAVAWPAVSPANAERIARRMQTALREAVECCKWPASFSLGVVVLSGDVTVDEAIRRADEAMYAAKRRGPGEIAVRVAVPDPAVVLPSGLSMPA